jgi:GTP-binding protein Era
MAHIRALVIVERDSQKGIVIGHKGTVLTKIGRDARLEIEGFIDKRVYLELFVKVDKDWRSTDGKLRKYGYKS